LQASYNSPKNLQLKERYEAIRASQLKNLKDFVFEKSKDDAFPVILLGDFNVNGRKSQSDGTDSEEYLRMMSQIQLPCFDMKDLLKDDAGFHPVTVGDVEVIDGTQSPKEIHLTRPEDQKLCKRLDYIFWLQRLDLPHDLQEQQQQQQHNLKRENESRSEQIMEYTLEVKPNSCKVEPLFVKKESKNIPFTQLSDHYGISAEFIFGPLNKTEQTETL